MSLDFDRSPDGEPTTPADQAPAPAQQAPATTDPAFGSGPSFTPADAKPEPLADETEGDETGPVLAETPDDEPADDEPAATGAGATETMAEEPTASEVTAYRSSAAPAWEADGTRTADGPADRAAGRPAGIKPTADLDGPLISDADELRTSWQRIQAAFVDNPREAVADAAGLVEHTAQALTGALRERQRQLRAMWDRDGTPDGVEYADSGSPMASAAAADGPETEQLRLLIQRYRALFNHLCRP
jgi:hypothetical protein